jgi:predicted amidophosphoribosyltransferase
MSKVALPTHETRAAGRVPLPRMVADKLFWFDRLSSSFEIRGILTIGWRFVDWMTDPWSSRFNRFKFGDARDARAGNTLALQALRLIDWSKLGTVGVTAALSSSAEVLDPNSRLSHLGQHCAADLHLRWHGDILRKKAHRALHTISGSAARATEVDGKYTCTKVPDCQLLLVCDDFATNGRTVSEIARAIHLRNKSVQVVGFALAKNERLSYAAAQQVKLSNAHIPSTWATQWDQHA